MKIPNDLKVAILYSSRFPFSLVVQGRRVNEEETRRNPLFIKVSILTMYTLIEHLRLGKKEVAILYSSRFPFSHFNGILGTKIV